MLLLQIVDPAYVALMLFGFIPIVAGQPALNSQLQDEPAELCTVVLQWFILPPTVQTCTHWSGSAVSRPKSYTGLGRFWQNFSKSITSDCLTEGSGKCVSPARPARARPAVTADL